MKTTASLHQYQKALVCAQTRARKAENQLALVLERSKQPGDASQHSAEVSGEVIAPELWQSHFAHQSLHWKHSPVDQPDSIATKALYAASQRAHLQNQVMIQRLEHAHRFIRRLQNEKKRLQRDLQSARLDHDVILKRLQAVQPLVDQFAQWMQWPSTSDDGQAPNHVLWTECGAVTNAGLSWLSLLNLLCGALLTCSTMYRRVLILVVRLLRMTMPSWLLPQTLRRKSV